ncbi:MAG: thioredoxin family protein, partial [Pedosphaera parvula]|nr:thioredoxin family protein [Pedosphaera parvula]
PMLATAIWMFWLTGRHFGEAGVLWFGLFLVVLALAAWVWGEFVQRGSKRRGLAMAVSLALLVFGYVYTMEKELNWRSPMSRMAGSGAVSNHRGEIAWEPWSPEAVAKAREAGRPILVDFTADWCLTCNVNKKTSIEIPSVEAKLKEINAVALLGDHTLQPPAITAELKKFNRAGVPLVLVYPKQKDAPPLVLPEVLTPGIMLDALDKAVRGGK